MSLYLCKKLGVNFSIAGIYDYWTNPMTGEEIRTFAMLTGEANELTGWIHNGGRFPNRMPMILTKEQEENWLKPDLSEEQIKNFFQTYTAQDMDAYAVNKSFRDFGNHNPETIIPQ